MNDVIRRILTKLEDVRRQGLACFGSDKHQFRLNPPLNEPEATAFERAHRIGLPEDYREFLTTAGNGGTGPYYGLLPLEQWDTAVLKELDDYLARPSPLRPNMPEGIDWMESLDCRWEELFQGTLALVSQGCAYYALLVVTGEYRGRVVYVNLDRAGVPYFVHHQDFLSWYERWLDELLWGYEDSWFGFGLPGREEDMCVLLRQAEVSAEMKEEALATLTRIPTLHAATLSLARTALREGPGRVRERAIGLLSKHRVIEAASDIRDCLTDRDAPVRQAAISAIASLKPVGWESDCCSALGDADRDVVFRAMCLLKDAHLLRKADVEGMLASSDPRVRSDALWAADSVVEGQGQVAIPEDSLSDPDRELRRRAILEVSHRRDRSKVPLLLDRLKQEQDAELLSCIVRALGHFRDRQATGALIEMTRHADAFVRQDTARALGELKDDRAVPALQALLCDTTKPIRKDEIGLPRKMSVHKVADEARRALKRLRRKRWWEFWR